MSSVCESCQLCAALSSVELKSLQSHFLVHRILISDHSRKAEAGSQEGPTSGEQESTSPTPTLPGGTL